MITNRLAQHILMLAVALCLTSTASAGVLIGILGDPATTSGIPTSTRSGPGTWHLYAIEEAGSTDFGISSYSVTLSGATAINHRSPNGSAIDENGDSQTWGFNTLRSATNSNPIVASQALPATSPYLLTGFGQEANTAANKLGLIQPATTGVIAISGPSWGTYSPALGPLAIWEAYTGHKFVFLAEGTGRPIITASTFTVYSNNTTFTSILTPSREITFLPEPSSAVLVLIGAALATCFRRRPQNQS